MRNAFITLIIIALPAASLAEKKAPGGAGGGYQKLRYGMAGCGIASLFIDKNEQLPQLGNSALSNLFPYLAIGNLFFCIDTSAMTTGTSNCTDSPSASAMLMEQQVFVSSNYDSITKEAAQGTGEHLVAFAEVLGCDAGAFASFTQVNHRSLFGQSPDATLETVKDLIRRDGILSCERV